MPVARPIHTVGIAICTLRRPEMLRDLLRSIAAQDVDRVRYRVSISVADNSPSTEGLAVVHSLAGAFPFPIEVDHEPTPGIAPTRNRSVRLLGPTDAVVFVDDDEVVKPDWLSRLLDTAERFDADVVSGPVHARYETTVPGWVVAGRFHDKLGPATGTTTGATATCNLLVRRNIFEVLGDPWFETSLALLGCDDTHFLERAIRSGGRAVWCDEALVIETIPAERTTLWWLVRRKFRGGNSWAIVQLMLDPGWKTKARLLAKGPLLIAGSLAALPIMVWRPVPRVRALRTLALGVGLVSAVGSLRYSEYAPRHRVPA